MCEFFVATHVDILEQSLVLSVCMVCVRMVCVCVFM